MMDLGVIDLRWMNQFDFDNLGGTLVARCWRENVSSLKFGEICGCTQLWYLHTARNLPSIFRRALLALSSSRKQRREAGATALHLSAASRSF
jgi:hypothetical protein